ncbi:MAG: GDSL-type esterase/lipase family protein [Victivallaceae bacterium]|nr:GDSL-type esterase/lipase family protein [Victivallaceae bacterium]MDD4318558.1 GDSL-type esterase/lipase family protein [Victivallaceae bacterium]
MKKLVVIAVWFVLLSAANATIIFRDGFEQKPWLVGDTWNGEIKLVNNDGIPRSGKKCVELSATGDGNGSYGRCRQIINRKDLWGKSYQYTIYAKGNGKFRIGTILYSNKNDGKRTMDYSWMDNYIDLTEKYQEISFNVQTADTDVYMISLLAEVQGKDSKVFLDDVALVEIKDPAVKLVSGQRHLIIPRRTPRPELRFQLSRNEKPFANEPMKLKTTDILDVQTDANGTLLYPAGTVAENEAGTIPVAASHPASSSVAEAFVDVVSPEWFATMDKMAKRIKLAKPLSILYIGDSLSDFDRGHNYVDKLDFFLNKYNPGKVDFYNYGVGGDYIERVLDRISGNPRAIRKERYDGIFDTNYDLAFIFLGHNDSKASSANDFKIALVPPEKQEKCYRALIAKLREKGIPRIVLISPTSSNFEVCNKNSQKLAKRVHNRFGEPKHLEAFDAVLKKLAAELNVEYLDVYSPTRNHPDKPELFRASDGVHLSTSGHRLMAEQLLQFMVAGQLSK